MNIKIYRIANNCGIPQAYRIKIKGYVFPRIKNDWYFCDSSSDAVELALEDYSEFLLVQKNKKVCLSCNQIIKDSLV